MKKSKNQKIQPKYRNIIIVLSVAVVALTGGLIYCGMNMKTAEEKEYLGVMPHLMSRHVDLMYDREGRACTAEEYGISKDNDPFVEFYCDEYENGELKERVDGYTLYFPHRAEATTGYAESLATPER